MMVSCIAIIEGCTTLESLNYNPLANVDNGSCVTPIYGCANPTAFNYYNRGKCK